MATVGFIGVGVMGREMVLNLLKGGHRVRVFDARPEAAESLRPDGAEIASSVADAGRGGDGAALERVRPVLAAMGTTIVHMGESGAGQVTKLCNQLVVGINLQGVCEAIALGRAAGVDLGKLRDALLGGAAASWMMQNLAPKILDKDADAGFRIDLMLKDLRLTGELAFALGTPLPGNALVTNLFLEARAHGEGHNGNQALYRVYDRLCNQET